MEIGIFAGVVCVTPSSFEEIAPALVGVFDCLGDPDQEEQEAVVLDLSPASEDAPEEDMLVAMKAAC
jgi:hypothetical protein